MATQGVIRAQTLSDRDRESLRARSTDRYGVPEEEIDGLIDLAEEVVAEVEAEFRQRVNKDFELLMDVIQEKGPSIEISFEDGLALRQQVERIHARDERGKTTPAVRLLAETVLRAYGIPF